MKRGRAALAGCVTLLALWATTAAAQTSSPDTTVAVEGYYTTTSPTYPTTTPTYPTTVPTTVPETTTMPETTTTGAPPPPPPTTTTTVAPTTTAAATTTVAEEKKVWVCKFVGKPGVDERLQTGQNPIAVSVNAIPNPPGPNVQIGDEFADAQGRSLVIAFFVKGAPEPGVENCVPTPNTTTTLPATTTTQPGTTTTSSSIPTGGLFSIDVAPVCPDGTQPEIAITFGNRPDLNGQIGTLTFSTGGSISLAFNSNGTTDVPYPASAGTGPVTMTYVLGNESVTRSTTFPEACTPATTTTTTTTPGQTTTTTQPGAPTTPATTSPLVPGVPTTLPETFEFQGAATVCVAEVPTIRISFLSPGFPSIAGNVGTLTMSDVNGNVVSTQPLVYQPGATTDLLYPGTEINPDGSIADVPGWELNSAGFWVRDPSDEFLREGINLTYTVNPTATAFITYPPESATCANPNGPFPPGTPLNPLTSLPFTTGGGSLPPAGGPWVPIFLGGGIAALGLGIGLRRRAS